LLGPGIAAYGGKREWPIPERIYPASTRVTMVLSYGARALLHNGPDVAHARAYPRGHVSGLTTDYATVSGSSEPRDRIVIQLAPQAARRLFARPMSEIADRRIGLDSLCGRDGRELYERCGETSAWDERFDAIDAFFHKRVKDDPPTVVERAIAAASKRLQSEGPTSIGAIAADLGWSHQTFIARFKDQIGVSPRRFARIARFERLLAALLQGKVSSFARAAMELDFYDQPHLAREARALAGATVTEVVKELARPFHEARITALL